MLKIIRNVLVKIKSIRKRKVYYYDLEIMPNVSSIVDKSENIN